MMNRILQILRCTMFCIALLCGESAYAGEILIGIPQEKPVDVPTEDWRSGIIDNQTFQVSLTEYPGETWFASYNENESGNDAAFRIILDDQVVETLSSYIPADTSEKEFKSVDAVSFADYDYDGDTDILIVKSWEQYTVGAVYDGNNAGSSGNCFMLNTELSDYVSQSLEEITIGGIMELLQGTKQEDEFPDEFAGMYYFASGVGAWESSINLGVDGSFDALFGDTDMGVSGDGYDFCAMGNTCTGRFTITEKVSDMCYRMILSDYQPDIPVGTEWIENRCLHTAADIRGLYPGQEFIYYLAGTPIAELPEEMKNWIFAGRSPEQDVLGGNYIYNTNGYGIFGGPY